MVYLAMSNMVGTSLQIQGDTFIQCSDGVRRLYPAGLYEQIARVFLGVENTAYRKPTGRVETFANGVMIQYWTPEDEPAGNIVSIADIARGSIVLRGPTKGQEHIPPIVDGSVINRIDFPLGKAVEIKDPEILRYQEEYPEWIVQWPCFNVRSAKMVIRAIMDLHKINYYFQVRRMSEGYWRLYPTGKIKTNLEAERASRNRFVRSLRGTKYPWDKLEPGVPWLLTDCHPITVRTNFREWARRRGIPWRPSVRVVGEGVVEVTRPILADPVRPPRGTVQRFEE